jgi:hypothetical protein
MLDILGVFFLAILSVFLVVILSACFTVIQAVVVPSFLSALATLFGRAPVLVEDLEDEEDLDSGNFYDFPT